MGLLKGPTVLATTATRSCAWYLLCSADAELITTSNVNKILSIAAGTENNNIFNIIIKVSSCSNSTTTWDFYITLVADFQNVFAEGDSVKKTMLL